MIVERGKNAIRNLKFGILLKLFLLLMPFIIRTLMINKMGIQYLGLNSLFTSIIQILNLAELGIGNAMVFCMYEPIACDDNKTINAILNLYRKSYYGIASIIAVVGLVALPFVPALVKSDLPIGMNIYILYLMNLSVTVLSYCTMSYRGAILVALQRNDIASKISLGTSVVQYLLQIIIIVLVKNYYIYLAITLFVQILNNLLSAYVAYIKYPQYRPEGCLDKEKSNDIIQRVRDLFTAKIGTVVVKSADTVVISAFLGLTVLAIYQNYFFIITSLTGIIETIYMSCLAGVGNSIVTETKKKNYYDLKKITMIMAWVVGGCVSMLVCLFQPFMVIWMGEHYLLSDSVVWCFVVYFWVFEINSLFCLYKDAGGIWHSDRFRALITALSNLVLNVLTVNWLGVYGVVLSTVVSTVVIGVPWLLHNLFHNIFELIYLKEYAIKILYYTVVTFTNAIVCCFVVKKLFVNNNIWTLFGRGIVASVLTIVLLGIAYVNTEDFKNAYAFIKNAVVNKR